MKVADAIATWWVRNAEIRHGHLPPLGNVVAPAQGQSPSLVARALPYVLSAAVGGGGMAAAAWMFDWLSGRKESPPAVVATDAPQNDGSLYQYLEDQNLHLPQ